MLFSHFSRFVDESPNAVLVNTRHEVTTVQVQISLPHPYLNALLRTSLSMESRPPYEHNWASALPSQEALGSAFNPVDKAGHGS